MKLFTRNGAVRHTDISEEDLAVLCRVVRDRKANVTIIVEGEGKKYPLGVESIDAHRTFGSSRYRLLREEG